MYKYLFGPVPSRRLGMSLGVDLVPKKVCSLNCVYCEVGKTTNLTLQRKEYIPYDQVTAELTDYFANNPDPDYITFSGSGEPTLNSRIGDVLNFIKKIRPAIPVALLTNGTLLYDKNLRKELLSVDVVLPSLDSATAPGLMKINRPPAELDVNKYIDGLAAFRKEFTGKIWLEVFILPGFNDSPDELAALKNAIQKIKPDSIQLNTLDRPGTVQGLKPASLEDLQKIIDFWNLPDVSIIASAPQRKKVVSYRKDMASAILETISRRPCTLDDLSQILSIHISEINKYLDVLEAENKIEAIEESRGTFYQKRNK